MAGYPPLILLSPKTTMRRKRSKEWITDKLMEEPSLQKTENQAKLYKSKGKDLI